MIGFARPAALLLALAPFALALWRLRKRPAAGFSSVELLLASNVRSPRLRLAWLPDFLDLLWCLLLVTALARPQVSQWHVASPEDFAAFVFVLDVSGSMGTIDSGVRGQSRLQRLKDLVRGLASRRMAEDAAARVGLIAFSNFPRVVCPLTTDEAAVLTRLDELKVDILQNRTNIGDALAAAVDQLQRSHASHGAIIVCSDGAHNVENAVTVGTAARLAQSFGYPVFCVGIKAVGDSELSLDEQSLQQVAQITGGRYFRAWEQWQLEQAAMELTQNLQQVNPRYTLAFRSIVGEVLLAALACLLLANLLRATWLRVSTAILGESGER